MTRSVARGDQWVWPDNGPPQVFITVTRVARDESWVDIRCFTWAASWGKRTTPAQLAFASVRRAWSGQWERDRGVTR